jgi:hypothetical protein
VAMRLVLSSLCCISASLWPIVLLCAAALHRHGLKVQSVNMVHQVRRHCLMLLQRMGPEGLGLITL